MLDKDKRIQATHRAFDRFFAYLHTPEGRRERAKHEAAKQAQPPITKDKALIGRACVAGELHVAEAIELVRRLP